MSRDALRPRLTVGVPVYNGAAGLQAALQSLREQTFADFEVVISDNGSTDGTGLIGESYAGLDSRFRYLRQPANLGAAGNFKFVLEQAQTPYFHWLAADDIRSPTFLADNVEFLDAHSDYVASTGRDRFLGETSFAEADFDIVGTQYERFHQFLANAPRSHGIFYSVVRTDVLRQCDVVGKSFWASDWAIDLFLAKHGNIHRASGAWSGFGTAGASSKKDAYRIFRGHPLEALFPFYSFSRYAWSLSDGLSGIEKLRFIVELASLNVRGAYDRTFSAAYRYYQDTLRPIVRRG